MTFYLTQIDYLRRTRVINVKFRIHQHEVLILSVYLNFVDGKLDSALNSLKKVFFKSRLEEKGLMKTELNSEVPSAGSRIQKCRVEPRVLLIGRTNPICGVTESARLECTATRAGCSVDMLRVGNKSDLVSRTDGTGRVYLTTTFVDKKANMRLKIKFVRQFLCLYFYITVGKYFQEGSFFKNFRQNNSTKTYKIFLFGGTIIWDLKMNEKHFEVPLPALYYGDPSKPLLAAYLFNYF